ncbi:hypothetical protein CSC08_2380 [Escherichia coli]|nr:hypothetical protein CSC08_2380 [Escherichia coli]RCG97772.1 hypothetical protein CSC20_0289 [Escherichia coli]
MVTFWGNYEGISQHLAFDGYPTGLDENYIETLTRQLLMD